MSTLTLRNATAKEGIPSIISYQKEIEPKGNRYWDIFQRTLEKVSVLLRNAFYLPLYKEKIDPALELDQKLAQKEEGLGAKKLEAIRHYFSIRDIPVYLEGSITRIFTVRLFESKIPIQEKKLRIILFSFNGNLERQGGNSSRRWEPLTIQALSESPLAVLRAFEASGVHIDSLATTSLGNVTLEAFTSSDQKTIPSTLIINRGLSSVQKVANQLYSFPLNYILYGAAKLCGWTANPEQKLLDFLENSTPRKVIIIEALNDYYFSGKGGLQLDLHEKISQLGSSVFRVSFYPFPYQIRSHHALSLTHLVNNTATKVLANTIPFSFHDGEKMSSVIARNIFLNGDEEYHTCFYVCGNDATLDIGTVREAMPLLHAFVKEGQKITQNSAIRLSA